MTEQLVSGAYMGWSCLVDTSKSGQLQQQLDQALAHFRKRHGHLPRAIALPEEGAPRGAPCPNSEQPGPAELTAPAGIPLLRLKSVRPGDIHLYL